MGNKHAWNEHNVHTLLEEQEPTEGQEGEKLLRLIFLILCHHLCGASSPRLPYWFDNWKTFLTFPHRGFLSLFRFICLSFPGSRMGFSSETSQHSASYLPLAFKLVDAHLCVGTHEVPVPQYVCLTANRKTKRNKLPVLHHQGRSFSYLLC